MSDINREYGYVRVSSKDQNPDRQIEKMHKLGIDDRFIFVEKQSGKDFDRAVYQGMKSTFRKGDLLYLDSIDRLGRNYEAVKEEWRELTRTIGVDVVALDMPDLFDSRKFKAQGDVGKLLEDQMLSLLAWVADQERKKINQRQLEGIARAKAEGKYKGRKPIEIDKAEFEAVYSEVVRGERTNKYAMKKLGLKPNTYYKAAKEFTTRTGRWE